MATISVKVENNELVIRAPLPKKGVPSKSGKSIVVVSTGGNMVTDQKFNGKPIVLGMNAYVKSDGEEE